MSLRRWLLPLPILGLVACSGGGTPDHFGGIASTPMAADTAESLATAFLLAEHTQASPSALPTLVPSGESGAFALMGMAERPGCVTVTATGPSTVVVAFQGCQGPHGGFLSGQVTFSWKPNEYTLVYQGFKASKGTKAWLLKGTRNIQLDPAAKQARISASGMSLVITDSALPSSDKTYAYHSDLTSNWATAGSYKVWGSFGAREGANPGVAGTINPNFPLTWVAGCCHPVSGTLDLQSGMATAQVRYSLPCGTLTLTPWGQSAVSKLLPACP